MAKRTMKAGKRASRKMGGKKGKKGARKTNRKMRGGLLGFGGPAPKKQIEWKYPFQTIKYALGLPVYKLKWDPLSKLGDKGVLTFSQPNVGDTKNFSATNLNYGLKAIGKDLDSKYTEMIQSKISGTAASAFQATLKEVGGMNSVLTISMTADNGEIIQIDVNCKDRIKPAVIQGDTLKGFGTSAMQPNSLQRIKDDFEIANYKGELKDPVPLSSGTCDAAVAYATGPAAETAAETAAINLPAENL